MLRTTLFLLLTLNAAAVSFAGFSVGLPGAVKKQVAKLDDKVLASRKAATMPAALSAQAGNGAAEISWAAVAGASSYNLYPGNTPQLKSIRTLSKTVQVTSPYILTGLTNDVTYYYAITSVANGIESNLSPLSRISPSSALPLRPEALSGTNDYGMITLRWNPVDGAASYDIYWSAAAGVTGASVKISVATNSYTHSGLEYGKSYYYRVSAVNVSGRSVLSTELQRTTFVLQASDYSQSSHWLSLPATVKGADVFYLYPAAWGKAHPADPNICEIDNAVMMIGAPAAFAHQATAFETVGNIYAPYYRQADAAFALSLPVVQKDALIAGAPTLDAVAAFDYYIKHYNKGRPFILAGHSQGSDVLRNLLSGYMKDNPAVYSKMIAAYALGTSITPAYLAANPHLHFATGPDDTSAIIAYNTQAPDIAAGANILILPGALVINPITWTMDETLATTAEGLGSFMPDPVTKVFTQVPQYADARIDIAKGALICSSADENALFALTGSFKGIYHNFDYPFYYYDLRANAADRTAKFMGN